MTQRRWSRFTDGTFAVRVKHRANARVVRRDGGSCSAGVARQCLRDHTVWCEQHGACNAGQAHGQPGGHHKHAVGRAKRVLAGDRTLEDPRRGLLDLRRYTVSDLVKHIMVAAEGTSRLRHLCPGSRGGHARQRWDRRVDRQPGDQGPPLETPKKRTLSRPSP